MGVGEGEQERYQVRFDWGADGAAAVGASADLLVWADAFLDDPPPRLTTTASVVRTALPTAAAAAQHLLDLQHALGRRAMVAVIAAGARRGTGLRFAVEDLLVAGAVIDALGALGIDATSPEAAAAQAAYTTLRGAVGHLMTAAVGAGEVPQHLRAVDPSLGVAALLRE